MKHLILFVLFVTSAAVQAQATDVELGDALGRSSARAPVVDAQLGLDDALRTQSRTESDPLALRLDLVQARQAVEQGRRLLAQARYDAYAEIAAAYVQALEAERQLALAEQGRDLAARSLDITRIRFERGSATELDVQNAETELARAESGVLSARQGLDLARDNLASLIGVQEPDPDSVPEELLAVEAPTMETITELLDRHPTILQAEHGVETARVARDLLDPSYASQAQIDQAELQVARAEEGLAEARRGMELQASRLRDAVERARESLDVEREALVDARERESLEERRFDAGLIAEITLDQARLTRAQAEIAALEAEHAFLRALFDLQAGTVTPIEGLDDY